MRCTCSESTAGRWGCAIHAVQKLEYDAPKGMPLEFEDVVRAKLYELERRIAALEQTQKDRTDGR